MNYRELIEKDDKEAIAAAVAEGFDPNGKDETLLPWLIVAVRVGAFNSLDALLQAGARPEGPEGDPLSPLMVAVKMSKLAAVDLLLRHGANPNRLLPQKRTALHLATSGPQAPQIVARLLAAEASPGAVDESGFTPLMKAASEGSTEVVEALLKAGADKDVAEPKGGQKAWDLAKAAGHTGVCEVIGAPTAAPTSPPPAPVLSVAAVPREAVPKPAKSGKPKRAAWLEKYDSEPVKPVQAAMVLVLGLIVTVLLFLKLQSMATLQ